MSDRVTAGFGPFIECYRGRDSQQTALERAGDVVVREIELEIPARIDGKPGVQGRVRLCVRLFADDDLTLDHGLDEVVASTRHHDPVIEQRSAAVVHRALRLSRREAAQPGVWRFLAVVHRPDFVRHRWAVEGWATTRTRYWQPGLRHDSNVFSRLWWIAELTRDGDDYSLTERVFARQTIAIQIFIRRYSWDRAAVAALIDELDDAPPKVVERVTRDLLDALGTLVLEALSPDELRVLIRDLRRSSTA